MRKYEHDTSYYGDDILQVIKRKTLCNPDIDRGGVYIWSIFQKTHASQLMIYLNLNENDYRGSLEFHRNGKFLSQIKCTGILKLNDECNDCIFDEDKLIDYLDFNLYDIIKR